MRADCSVPRQAWRDLRPGEFNRLAELLRNSVTHHLLQVGMGSDNLTIPISTVLGKELTIKGSFRFVYSLSLSCSPIDC